MTKRIARVGRALVDLAAKLAVRCRAWWPVIARKFQSVPLIAVPALVRAPPSAAQTVDRTDEHFGELAIVGDFFTCKPGGNDLMSVSHLAIALNDALPRVLVKIVPAKQLSKISKTWRERI